MNAFKTYSKFKCEINLKEMTIYGFLCMRRGTCFYFAQQNKIDINSTLIQLLFRVELVPGSFSHIFGTTGISFM